MDRGQVRRHDNNRQVQSFLWKRIIYRHGLPHNVVTDNDKQFTDSSVELFLKQLGVKHLVSSVEHPQTNGQAETANRVILTELRKKLGQLKGLWAEEILGLLWAEEIPGLLWGYHCTRQSSTKETPYRLHTGLMP